MLGLRITSNQLEKIPSRLLSATGLILHPVPSIAGLVPERPQERAHSTRALTHVQRALHRDATKRGLSYFKRKSSRVCLRSSGTGGGFEFEEGVPQQSNKNAGTYPVFLSSTAVRAHDI